MFFDLTSNVKDKIINTLKICFELNPNADFKHTKISDRFPRELKSLPAIIVKNASSTIARAGVDDYVRDIVTNTGDVRITRRRGTSIKDVKLQKNHMLYCVTQPEVFKIEILENNRISFLWQNTKKRFGPVPVIPGSKIVDLLFDVEIELDSLLVPGDFAIILLIPINGSLGRVYGGLFEMELSLTIMAESTQELEEIADWTIMSLNYIRKPELEREDNILIKEMKHTGEAEIPELKDFIYTAGIDISLRSQWSQHVEADQYITNIDFIDIGEVETCDGVPLSLID